MVEMAFRPTIRASVVPLTTLVMRLVEINIHRDGTLIHTARR